MSSRGETIRCTVSIGVAEYQAGEVGEALVQRADQACYAAKARGKNCVATQSGT